MTGNLVLIGLIQRAHYLETLLGAGVAIAVFVVALYFGFRRMRHAAPDDTPADEGRIFQLLSVAAVAQALVLVGWVATGAAAVFGLQLILIAFSAAAMALQTVVGRRLSAQTGVTTTFVTGTLTTLMQHIAEGAPGPWALSVAAVAALVAGSFAGAICLLAQPLLAPALPVLAIVSALFLMRPVES